MGIIILLHVLKKDSLFLLYWVPVEIMQFPHDSCILFAAYVAFLIHLSHFLFVNLYKYFSFSPSYESLLNNI